MRWRIASLVTTTVGVCLSADLTRLHVKVHTDPAYHSYCAISEWANCETVAASDYAVFLGLPVAVWGLLSYLAIGVLTVWGLYRPFKPPSWPFGILFWMNIFSAAISTALFVLSHFVIQSVCVVCMGTYLVNFLLLFLSAIEVRRLDLNPLSALLVEVASFRERRSVLLSLGAIGSVTVVVLWLAVPRYWELSEPEGPGGIPVGVTEQGHPWIGARKPTLVIEEFSDYQCPYCQRGHDEMRKLIQSNPDSVRLVHRHYPLDMDCNRQIKRPFHPHACRYAAMAVCAQRQGRFWEANDYLFSNGRRNDPVGEDELARAIEIKRDQLAACLKDEETGRELQLDLEKGRALKIQGTPTYVIGDRTYPGSVPPEALSSVIGKRSGGR